MMLYKETRHVDDLVSDYVLGLLTGLEGERVATHAASCEHCRRLILQERDLLQLVRSSISAASCPPSAQLDRLMPSPARRPQLAGLQLVSRRGLTLVVLMLMVIVAGVVVPKRQGPDRAPSYAPTVFNTSVVATYTPTLTATLTGAPQLSPSALARLHTVSPDEVAPHEDPPTPAITPNPEPLLQ